MQIRKNDVSSRKSTVYSNSQNISQGENCYGNQTLKLFCRDLHKIGLNAIYLGNNLEQHFSVVGHGMCISFV